MYSLTGLLFKRFLFKTVLPDRQLFGETACKRQVNNAG